MFYAQSTDIAKTDHLHSFADSTGVRRKDNFAMKIILFLSILVLLLSVWLLPSVTPALALILLLFSFACAAVVVLRKHRAAYREGRLTHSAFLRNIFLDVLGILLAMTLAVLLARWVAGIVARPIRSDTSRLLAYLLIGLLAGIGVGALVNRLWGRFIKKSPEA